MKPGYKQTEVGVIPEDWDSKPLSELLVCLCNGAVYQPTSGSGLPVTRIETIADGTIDLARVGSAAATAQIEAYRMQAGDILFSHINSLDHIGKVAFYCGEPPLYHGMNLLLLRVGHALDSKFLFYWLGSYHGRKKAQILAKQAVSQASINTSEMKAVAIPVPPLPEQRAIAGALSDVDALLGAQEALLAKKRDLKAAAMQQLLTGETRLPGFTGEWEVVTMRQVLTQNATYGIVTAGNFVQNGVKMLRGGDIADGRINTDLPMVTLEKSTEYHRTSLAENDVVIALVGYPGASAKIPKELSGSNISRAVGLLRTNSKVSADFLVCFLNSPDGRRMVLAPSAGSAQQVVNLAALNKLQFSLPPLPEQTAIAAVLSDMDAEIAALEAQRDKTRALKQGMMQELLTGRIGLV